MCVLNKFKLVKMNAFFNLLIKTHIKKYNFLYLTNDRIN